MIKTEFINQAYYIRPQGPKTGMCLSCILTMKGIELMKTFALSRIPRTFFGKGSTENIFNLAKAEKSRSILLITGQSSFLKTPHYQRLIEGMKGAGIKVLEATAAHEPSPELVDHICASARQAEIDLVLAIGGGSVLDTGKAVSAMVKASGSVMDYLEGVGTKVHDGSKIPFIAVPTTSGTGSEATKNAVLSRIGSKGFKKSLRHDNFVPDYAILDPELTLTCPVPVTAASGMDALNQLLEGYLSVKSNPYTDSLALSGIQKIMNSLVPLCLERPEDVELRGEMAYSAYLSGIVLANAGLGYVHGFAGVIGGMADLPHGLACAKLNAGIFDAVAHRVMNGRENYPETYEKLLTLGTLAAPGIGNEAKKILSVIDRFYSIEEELKLPSFSSLGIEEELLKEACDQTSGKESPVKLTSEEILKIAAKNA